MSTNRFQKSRSVLNVTGGDKPAKVDVDNLQAEQGFKGLMTYTHSKSVMEAMSMGLARELEPEVVFVNVVFPGRASTSMTQPLTKDHLPGPMKLMMPLFEFMLQREDGGKSATKAATSSIWAATAPELEGNTLVLREVAALLHQPRAVGSKPLKSTWPLP